MWPFTRKRETIEQEAQRRFAEEVHDERRRRAERDRAQAVNARLNELRKQAGIAPREVPPPPPPARRYG